MKTINCNVSGYDGSFIDIPFFSDDNNHIKDGKYNETFTRISFPLDDSYTGGGHIMWRDGRVDFLIPSTPGSYEGSDLGIPTIEYKVVIPVGNLYIAGDSFYYSNGERFIVRGSTEFGLPYLFLEGNGSYIIQDRTQYGTNWFRMLSMKFNNTGYEFLPRDPRHNDAVKRTFDAIGNYGAYGQYDIFADTAALMPDSSEQLDYYHEQLELVQPYSGFIVVGLCNEKSHGTQKFNNFNQFTKPDGILSSHGSELTDQLPVTPFWDWAGFSARRSGGLGKVVSNYSPLTSFEQWPAVCMIPQEGLKPENYGYDTEVARQLGKNARVTTGGIFHHNAWVEMREFNPGEASCASSFYSELM